MDTNASALSVQLQIIRVVLAVIAYRVWNFRAMDVSRAFSGGSGRLKRDAYVDLPEGVGIINIARKLLKPLYGLSTACKYRYKTIMGFLAKWRVCACGGGGDYFPG